MRERTTAVTRAAIGVVTAATLMVGLVPQTASAGDRYAHKLLRIVNATRRQHHLPALRLDRSLNAPARRHSQQMIDANRIYDPPGLQRILSGYTWDDLGADVVGCGRNLHELHRILMSEPFHRTILLHPQLRRVGMGVVVARQQNRCGRGSVWATEIFYG
jgi:uncharacterized protein YkwD